MFYKTFYLHFSDQNPGVWDTGESIKNLNNSWKFFKNSKWLKKMLNEELFGEKQSKKSHSRVPLNQSNKTKKIRFFCYLPVIF